MNRNKIITLVILSIAIIAVLYLVYFAKSENTEVPTVIQSTATSSDVVAIEPAKKDKRFITGGLTITDLPSGWEIQNRAGNILQVKQGEGTVMELSQAVAVTPDDKLTEYGLDDFKDVDLAFDGEVTVNVTADHSRQDTFELSLKEAFFGPIFYPVTISSSTISKLPSVPSDTRTPKFCVANERIPHDVHKKMYGNETEFTFNVYIIGFPNSDPKQSCTHMLIFVQK